MSIPIRALRGISVAFVLAAPQLIAQWPEVKTKGVPLTRDGKPNLKAPAPKLKDGKTPDLSGVWDSVKTPCEGTSLGNAFGCSDAPFGIPLGFVDVSATRPEEWESGRKDGLPYQPWAMDLVKQRMAAAGKDDPLIRCLPMSPVQ